MTSVHDEGPRGGGKSCKTLQVSSDNDPDKYKILQFVDTTVANNTQFTGFCQHVRVPYCPNNSD